MTERETIWVVRGTTGEWSDREEWSVCAFRTEAAAVAFVAQLDALLLKLELSPGNVCDREVRERRAEQLREADPFAQIDYTGVRYFCESVEVRP